MCAFCEQFSRSGEQTRSEVAIQTNGPLQAVWRPSGVSTVPFLHINPHLISDKALSSPYLSKFVKVLNQIRTSDKGDALKDIVSAPITFQELLITLLPPLELRNRPYVIILTNSNPKSEQSETDRINPINSPDTSHKTLIPGRPSTHTN